MFLLREPKTELRPGTLAMPRETFVALQARSDGQCFQRKAPWRTWQESSLIFATIEGAPMAESRIHDHWTPAVKKAGLPRYRIHDLRHSVASNLVAASLGLLEVAYMLGHSNASTVTTVYGYAALDDHRRAAALMDTLLQRRKVRSSTS